MSEFLNMGGYAVYVWSSYAIVATVLVVNLVVPYLRHKQLLRELVRRRQRGNAR